MLAALSMLCAGEVQATEFTFDGRASLSFNRVGLSLEARPGFKTALPNLEEGSVLFGDSHVKTEGHVYFSPAYLRLGARSTIAPIAVFETTPYVYYSNYFGNFQTFITYDGADVNYGTNDDIEVYVGAKPTEQDGGTGFHLGDATTLKAKVGPVIVLANFDYSYWNYQPLMRQSGDWWFERETELMMAVRGEHLLQFNGMALYEKELDALRIRVGSLTTWRRTVKAQDTMARTGLLAQVAHGENHQWNHTLIAEPYLTDRAYTTAFPPFVAYQFKYVL